MQSVDTGFKCRLFTGVLDALFNFLLSFFDRLLNAGRMNPSIADQFFQGKTGDFASNRVEAGNQNGFGGIINYQINAG